MPGPPGHEFNQDAAVPWMTEGESPGLLDSNVCTYVVCGKRQRLS